jgi:uncharacterized caspase-like protein
MPDAKNPHDHAVVIGIRRYVDADDPSKWIGNLNGPDNDADAVAEWLRKAEGGGLPAANVHVIRSADLPDPFPDRAGAGPQQKAIEDALKAVARLPDTAYEGQYAGRRVYIYVTGHGFAKKIDEAALMTAEAEKGDPANVLVTSWLDWLYAAARFKEYVLWVDCCATRAPISVLHPCRLDEAISRNADSGRRFVSYAAGLGKTAVENEMPDGKWHGVFTYTLLKGLEGAATGEVTSDSLRDYLRNNMKSFMRDEQRVSSVSLEPVFGPTDPISFVAPGPKPKFAITLRFPDDWVGKRVTISANGSSLAADTVLAQAEWKPELEAGSYAVFVPDMNHSQAFTVSGEETDAVTVP